MFLHTFLNSNEANIATFRLEKRHGIIFLSLCFTWGRHSNKLLVWDNKIQILDVGFIGLAEVSTSSVLRDNEQFLGTKRPQYNSVAWTWKYHKIVVEFSWRPENGERDREWELSVILLISANDECLERWENWGSGCEIRLTFGEGNYIRAF